MSELQLLILVTAIALATGFAIGGWVYAGRNPSPTKTPPSQKEQGEKAFFRAWRDPDNGRLRIDIQDEEVKAPNELSPQALEAFQRALDELNRWAGKPQEAVAAFESLETATSHQLTSATLFPTSINESKSPRLNPVDVIAQAMRSDVRKPEAHPASIAAQIDVILQEKLAANAAITRAVRLLEMPGKGMVVMVGLDQYAGVDEVPDDDVRAIIHEAVAEWERRVES